jgi:hypothetical protein
MKTKMDPALAKQLAEAGERTVEAVFQLRPCPPERTRKVVQNIVDRAQARARRKAEAVTVFENLHCFAARGDASLIKELANSEQVSAARLNRITEDVLIRPVKSRKVAAKDLKKHARRA